MSLPERIILGIIAFFILALIATAMLKIFQKVDWSKRKYQFSLPIRIILAIIIFFVAALSPAAVLQKIGFMEHSGVIIGFIAGGLFLMFARGKDKQCAPHKTSPEIIRSRQPSNSSQKTVESSTKATEALSLDPKEHSIQRRRQNQVFAPEAQKERGTEDVIQSNEKENWSEEFRILNEYDPVVKECHDELEDLNPQLSSQFRDEAVLDRKKSKDIRDRLKAEHEKK